MTAPIRCRQANLTFQQSLRFAAKIRFLSYALNIAIRSYKFCSKMSHCRQSKLYFLFRGASTEGTLPVVDYGGWALTGVILFPEKLRWEIVWFCVVGPWHFCNISLDPLHVYPPPIRLKFAN